MVILISKRGKRNRTAEEEKKRYACGAPRLVRGDGRVRRQFQQKESLLVSRSARWGSSEAQVMALRPMASCYHNQHHY